MLAVRVMKKVESGHIPHRQRHKTFMPASKLENMMTKSDKNEQVYGSLVNMKYRSMK